MYSNGPYQSQQQTMPLQPMGIGDLLDTVFKAFKRAWKKLLLFGLIAMIPTLVQVALSAVFVIQAFSFEDSLAQLTAEGQMGGNPLTMLAVLVPLGLSFIVTLLLGPLFYGAAAQLTSDVVLDRPVSVRAALKASASRYFGLLGTMILQGLLLAIVPVVLMGLTIYNFVQAFSDAGSPAAIAPTSGLMFLLAMFGIMIVTLIITSLVGMYTCLSTHTLMLEAKPGGFAPIRRSFQLVRGNFWRMFLLSLVYFGATMALGMVFLIVTGPIAFIAATTENPVMNVAGQFIGSLAGIITTPLLYLGLTVAYYDLRMRKEGFDLELQAARQLESNDPTAGPV